MHIWDDNVYDKHTGDPRHDAKTKIDAVIFIGAYRGFINLGDIQSHLASLERSIDGSRFTCC